MEKNVDRKTKIIMFELIVIIILFISNYLALFHNGFYISVLNELINGLKEIFINFYLKVISFLSWISSQEYDWTFSNREKAIGIIVSSVAFWMIIEKERRKSLFDLLKIIFNKQFIRIYIEIFVYTVLVTFLLYRISFWDFNLTKDTLFWMVFTSIYFTYKSYEKRADEKLFSNLIKGILKGTVVFEFVINLYTFPIFVEVIGIVILFFLGAMIGLTDFEKYKSDKKYKDLKKVLEGTLSFIGVLILVYVFRSIIINWGELFTIGHLKELLIPLIYSLLFIPFIYFLLIRICYSEIISFLRYNENLRIRDKFKFLRLVAMKNRFNRMALVILVDRHSSKIRNVKSISTLLEIVLN